MFCEVARSDAADIELALDAAHKAFASWSKTSVTERSNLLLRIADRIEQNIEVLAVAETWENGKAVRETLAADLPLVVDHFRYFAGCIRAQEGSAAELDQNTVSYHFKEPIGVVGAITPWNYPLHQVVLKVGGALAAGCTVVLKPSEVAPLNAFVLAEIMQEAGVPAGVFNLVTGTGPGVGETLVAHEQVDMVSLTGSTAAGRRIGAVAAQTIKRVGLELGGKSPTIVFDDADLEAAVGAAIMANFYSSGQVCSNGTRVFVQEGIRERFLERLAERIATVRIGDPRDPAVLARLVDEVARDSG